MTSLPPTINTLDSQQRMRLVRSNRKLESVLGIAPYVIDEDPPSSPTSITSSDSDDWKPRPLSRPLLLRLRSLPSAIDNKRRRKLPDPPSPAFTINFETKQSSQLPLDDRRRKLAKLTRTLGENVPVDLVFGTKHISGPRPLSRPSPTIVVHRPRSFSFDSDTTPNPLPLSSPPTQTTIPIDIDVDIAQQSYRIKNEIIRGTLDTTQGPTSPAPFRRLLPAAPAASSSRLPNPRHRTTRSESISSIHPTDSSPGVSTSSIARSTTSSARPSTSTGIGQSTGLGAGRRNEREWSGEWNRLDMEQVVRGLRGLKVKAK